VGSGYRFGPLEKNNALRITRHHVQFMCHRLRTARDFRASSENLIGVAESPSHRRTTSLAAGAPQCREPRGVNEYRGKHSWGQAAAGRTASWASSQRAAEAGAGGAGAQLARISEGWISLGRVAWKVRSWRW
jgi:hypothetical protein